LLYPPTGGALDASDGAPSPPSVTLRVVDGIVQLALVIAAVRVALGLERYLADDAFVALRVAENVLRGHGWVFNIGEYVNACAGPLHVVILIALNVVGIAGPQSLLVAFGLGLGAIAVVQYRVFRVEGHILALFVVAVTTTSVLLLWSTGLETPLFVASIAAVAWAYQWQRPMAMGVLMGCSALLRPEGLALFLLMPLVSYAYTRTISWRSLLVGGALYLPWLLFAWAYFGAPWPDSSVITSARSTMTGSLQPSWIIAFVREQPLPYVTIPLAIAGLIVAYLQFLAVRRFLVLWCSFCVLHVAAYSVLDTSIEYPSYFVPGTLTINLLLALLLFTMSRWLATYATGRARWAMVPAGMLLKLVGTLAVARLIILPLLFSFPHPALAAHRTVGQWLAANSPRDAVIAVGDIGYVGYFSDRRIVDIDRPLARDLPSPRRLGWMEGQLPDVIVMHDPAWPNEPSKAWSAELYGRFASNYRMVFNAWSLVVYRRG
jgi:arabinofuranosyltransferase